MKTLSMLLASNSSRITYAAILAMATSACGGGGGGSRAKPLSSQTSPQQIATPVSVQAVQISSPTGGALLTKTDSTTITGTCAPGAGLTLSGDVSAADVLIPSAALSLSCASGTFQYKVQKTSDGAYHLKVTQDLDSTEAALVVTRDATAPSAPTLATPSSATVTTAGSSLSVTGACETGATVALAGAATQSTACASSAYSFTVPASADGTFNYTLAQTDPAGNTSAATALNWIRDTAAPSAPVLTAPASCPLVSSASALTFSGSCEAGATVKLGGADTLNTACTSGTFSLTSNKSTDAVYAYNLTQTDAAGNTSSATACSWTRDTTAPSAPTISSPAANPFTSGGSALTLSGGCETGALVALTGSSTQTATCAASAFSFNLTVSADATYNYSLKQTDAAGNASGSTAFQWIRNSATPAAIVLTSPSTNPLSNNASSLTIAGTCTTGMTVAMSGSSTQNQTCAASAFSFNVTASADGTNNYSLIQTNTANGLSSGPVTAQWIRDTVAPSAVALTAPASCPLVSNASSLALSGSCEAGATVKLTGADTLNAACASGTFSFTSAKSSDGIYAYSLAQTDAAGNTSSATACQWTRDAAAPSAPTITTPASNPLTSNTSAVTIAGACETGATIQVSGSATQTATCASSAYSLSVGSSADGTFNYSIAQTDAAGNASSAVAFQWLRDTVAPSAPTILMPPSNPLTSAGSTLSISGGCEVGATVALTGSATQSAACPSGSYALSVSASSDGTYNYSIAQTDLAGNASSATAFSWIRDTTPPPAPVITSPATSPVLSNASTLILSGTCSTGMTVALSGASTQSQSCASAAFSFTVTASTDGTYNYSVNQTSAVTGVTSSAATLQWQRDTVAPGGLALTTPASCPVYSSGSTLAFTGTCEIGTTVSLGGGTSQNAACTTGTFSFTASQVIDGSITYTVGETDAAGNAASSLTCLWNRDTTAPSNPTISSPTSNPFTSGGTALTLSGACETDASVDLTGSSTQNTTCASGAYNFALTVSADGTYNYSLKQTDLAGNSSSGTTFQWVRNNATPSAPVLTSPATNPINNSASALTIAGTCTTGMSISMSGAAAQTHTCASSAFSFSVSSLVDGAYNYSLVQTNTANGQSSSPITVRWNRDTSAPVVPVITNPATCPVTTGDSTLALSGTCETGTTVALSGSDSQSTTCAVSAFSFTSTQSTDGTYAYSIAQTDAAGNVSPAASCSWTRDSSIPASPVIALPATTPFYSNGSALTISGSCLTGNNITLDGDSAQAMTCTSSAFSFTVNESTDGAYSFYVAQENAAGTPSNSVQVQWFRDATAPSAPTITTPAVSPYTSSGSLTLAGACESNTLVELYGDDSQSQTCTSSHYSFTISKSDGTYSFSVKQTDQAGNVSSPKTQQWIRDTSIPATPILAQPSTDPYISNTGTVTLSGTCDDGMTVTLSGDVTTSDVTTPLNSLNTSCSASNFTFVVAKATDATYNFSVLQTNASGISSGADTLQWVRDTVAPTVTLATFPTNPNLSASASFTFSSNETGSILECQLDSGSWAACVSPLNYATVTNGSRTLNIRATDLAGNISAVATKTWLQSAYNTLALYHLDSAAPTTDSSLYTSTNNNTLTTNTGTSTAASSVSAAYNQAVTFAGAGIMSAPDSSSLGLVSNGKMTAEAYIKFSAVPGSGSVTIMSQHGSTSGSYGWEVRLTKNASKYRIQLVGSVNGTSITTISATSYSSATYTGAFHHLAVTFNLGTVKIYWDGAQIGSGTIGTAGSAKLFNTTTAFRIGQNAAAANKMSATIDEVRISQTVRYSAAFTKPTTPFTAD